MICTLLTGLSSKEGTIIMKTLVLAEYKKLHRSKLIFLLVFALIMTLGVVFLQGQFSFGDKKYIDTFVVYFTGAVFNNILCIAKFDSVVWRIYYLP